MTYIEFSIKGRFIAKAPYDLQELVDSLEVDLYSHKFDIDNVVIHEIDIN